MGLGDRAWTLSWWPGQAALLFSASPSWAGKWVCKSTGAPGFAVETARGRSPESHGDKGIHLWNKFKIHIYILHVSLGFCIRKLGNASAESEVTEMARCIACHTPAGLFPGDLLRSSGTWLSQYTVLKSCVYLTVSPAGLWASIGQELCLNSSLCL